MENNLRPALILAALLTLGCNTDYSREFITQEGRCSVYHVWEKQQSAYLVICGRPDTAYWLPEMPKPPIQAETESP